MIDNINIQISANNLLYFLAPPHRIFKDSSTGTFKYANMNINNWTTSYQISSLSNYEWNRIIISAFSNQITQLWEIKLYVNYYFVQSEISLPNSLSSSLNMSLRGILFCNKPISNCVIDGVTYTPEWGNAWYRNIRIWDYTVTSLEMIQSFERM